MIKPILIQPILYVLLLENNKYYIGITMNLNQRIAQHFSGDGSKWTKLHKPITIVEVQIKNVDEKLENEITLHYINKYGKENVRGGSYCRINIK